VVGSYFLFAVGTGVGRFVSEVCPDATRKIGRSATHSRESRQWYLSVCAEHSVCPRHKRGV